MHTLVCLICLLANWRRTVVESSRLPRQRKFSAAAACRVCVCGRGRCYLLVSEAQHQCMRLRPWLLACVRGSTSWCVCVVAVCAYCEYWRTACALSSTSCVRNGVMCTTTSVVRNGWQPLGRRCGAKKVVYASLWRSEDLAQ